MTPRARIWRLFSFCKAPQASRHAPRSRYLRRPSSTETVFRSSSRRLVLANSREATTSGQDQLRSSSQRLVLANSREATTRDRLRSFSRRRTARVLADVAMARPRGPSRSRDQKGEISARPRASRRARRSTARSRTRCTCERKTPASPLVGVAMSRNGAPRWRCYVRNDAPRWRCYVRRRRPSSALLCPQRRPSSALPCPQHGARDAAKNQPKPASSRRDRDSTLEMTRVRARSRGVGTRATPVVQCHKNQPTPAVQRRKNQRASRRDFDAGTRTPRSLARARGSYPRSPAAAPRRRGAP